MGAEPACQVKEADSFQPDADTREGKAEGADAGRQLQVFSGAAAGGGGGKGKPEGAGRMGGIFVRQIDIVNKLERSGIVVEFKRGASTGRLARKYGLKIATIERIIRNWLNDIIQAARGQGGDP